MKLVHKLGASAPKIQDDRAHGSSSIGQTVPNNPLTGRQLVLPVKLLYSALKAGR